MSSTGLSAEDHKEVNQGAAHKEIEDERRFILLGVLLQSFHVLFGISAFFGMFLNVTQLPKMESAIWIEHCRWQITTFWIGIAAYAVTLTLGFSLGIWWPFILASMWVSYRIICSALGVAMRCEIQRFRLI